jgi:hypothetical protein
VRLPCYTARMVLTVNSTGELVLPPELVQAPPGSQIEGERQGEALVLKQVADPLPRRGILDGWPTFPAGLVDPNMTFRREDIYDDDGR